MNNKVNVFNNATNGLRSDNAMARMKRRVLADYDENSPVDNTQLPHLNQRVSVILTDAVYETLQMIADMTNERGNEVPFLLFGKYDFDNEMFVFDDVEGDASVGNNPHEANASDYLEWQLGKFVKDAQRGEDKVFALGHSHPRVGAYYTNFSLGDMRGYVDTVKNQNLKNISMVCGCLLTGGNFNFVLCNADGSDVYRIDNVFVYKQDGSFARLPCFGPDIAMLSRGRGREM